MVCKEQNLGNVFLILALLDCVICLWKFSGEGEKASASRNSFASGSSGVANQESWSVTKTLRLEHLVLLSYTMS